MIKKDSVSSRMSSSGISFTEFSYQLFQAYDFVKLYEEYGCNLQLGGSDQFGNIVAGTGLLKKTKEIQGYGITCNLLTKADGTKFGKSEKGNIWLDANLTSPYEFYQFWFNAADEDIEKFNRYFSLINLIRYRKSLYKSFNIITNELLLRKI